MLIAIAGMSRARESAIDVKCLGNIRNYGSALMTYLADHRQLPYWNGNASEAVGNSGESRFPQFESWVRPYLHQRFENRLRCPKVAEYRGTSHYTFNYTGNSGFCMTYRRVFDTPAPLHKLVIAAEYGDFAHFYWDAPFNTVMWNTPGGDHGMYNGVPANRDTNDRPHFHGSGTNRGLHFFFADGHAALVRPQGGNWRMESGTATYADGSNNGIVYDYRQLQRLKSGVLRID